MPSARINGFRTNYDVAGRGLPALFIHGGYGGAATTLVPQPNTVAGILPSDQFQTITYDRRSAGLSEYILTEYTIEDLAADAAALLDHLGHERAVIIGSSAGGPIALQFAFAYPGRVIGLSLPNTGPNLSSTERPVGVTRRNLVEQARADGDRAVFESRKAKLREVAPAGVAPPAMGAAERIAERQKAVAAALATVSDDDLCRYFGGEIRNYGAYLGYDFTARLAELAAMSVCIIHGDADATVPYAWGEALHRGIPGSELHTVAGGGHGILAWPEGAKALRSWAAQFAAN